MLKKINTLVFYYLPPILIMIIIFFLSGREKIGIADTYILNFIVFKTLHIIEYGLLFILTTRALKKTNLFPKTYILYAIYISILYALSDEYHQMLVLSREGIMRDVIIDSIGIYIAYYIVFVQNKYNIQKIFA